VPTINLTDDELAAVTAAVRRAIETDRYPYAPRLDPLRVALGKFDAETADRKSNAQNARSIAPRPAPKAPPPAKAD
jgi:hypothetical protein